MPLKVVWVKPKRKRRLGGPHPTAPWYKNVLEYTVLIVGLFAVNVMFSARVDKDEYQRMGGTAFIVVVGKLLEMWKKS